MSNINQVPFTFTKDGYSAPIFTAVPFYYTPSYSQTADMVSVIRVMQVTSFDIPATVTGLLRPIYNQTSDVQSSIEIGQIYQDSTYTYLKNCPKIVVGYKKGVPQILSLPCVYGGIRDIGSYIIPTAPSKDLLAYIFGLSDIPSYNLSAFIRPCISDLRDINSFIKQVYKGDKELSSFLRSTESDYSNLIANLHGLLRPIYKGDKNISSFLRPTDPGYLDLISNLHGYDLINLSSYVLAIPCVDLISLLNVISINDLPAYIYGEYFKGISNLEAKFSSIIGLGYVNLPAFLHGWQIDNLSSYLNVIHYSDLCAYVGSNSLSNLIAILSVVLPVDLSSTVHGFATRDVSSHLIGVYSPYDIQAYVTSIPPVNLPGLLHAYKGTKVPTDLFAFVESYQRLDLLAHIRPNAPFDLLAYLNSVGKSSGLLAYIVPKVIHVKRSIQIALLEHKDLKSIINFMCFNSDSRNLSAYIFSMIKRDLGAHIIGWYGSTTDNIKDLPSYINTGIIHIENKIPIRFVPVRTKFASLRIKFSTENGMYSVNAFPIHFSAFNHKTLTASILGIMRSTDMSARIKPVVDANYTQLPYNVKPKTHEVFINLERFEEQYQKFVELMFSSGSKEPFHYFYVSGENKLYKIDRRRSWTIWAHSYSKLDNNIFERGNVRHKFIFKLSNYASIDEAVRDLMDRAVSPRKYDLVSIINAVDPVHSNLVASIEPKRKIRWSKKLTSTITCRNRSSYAMTLIFDSSNYTPPNYDDVELNWEEYDKY
jgi:hypothetical protein